MDGPTLTTFIDDDCSVFLACGNYVISVAQPGYSNYNDNYKRQLLNLLHLAAGNVDAMDGAFDWTSSPVGSRYHERALDIGVDALGDTVLEIGKLGSYIVHKDGGAVKDLVRWLWEAAYTDIECKATITTFLSNGQAWLAYGDTELLVPFPELTDAVRNERKRRLLDLLHLAAGNEDALGGDVNLRSDYRPDSERGNEREIDICIWDGSTCLRIPGDSVQRVPTWGEGSSLVSLIEFLHEAAHTGYEPQDPGSKVVPEPLATRIVQAAQPVRVPDKFKRVYVAWTIATRFPGGLHPVKDSYPLEVVETAGWLVGETDSALLVAQTVNQCEVGDVLAIPKSAVVKEVEQ